MTGVKILLIEARKDGFSLKHATLWFFFIYIGMHFITIFIYPIESVRYPYVYTGGANNPNQIVYYSMSLSLLLAVFYKKFSLYHGQIKHVFVLSFSV